MVSHKSGGRYSESRAKKKEATYSTANLIKRKEMYDNCPPGHHVDHIVPLSRGGLHHEDNLQYLTASENCRKQIYFQKYGSKRKALYKTVLFWWSYADSNRER